MRAWLHRLRDRFRRRAIARDFDEEMAFHLAELEQVHRARGASAEAARAAARREFGNSTRAREELRAQAGFPTWDELASDWGYAWRGICRRPGLALSVTGILVLGLGSAATIYGLIDAVFLRPLPVAQPEQLVAIQSSLASRPNRISHGTVHRLEDLLPPATVAGYSSNARGTVRVGAAEATQARYRLVDGQFFAALRVQPLLGRPLQPEDDRAGQPTDTVVVSSAWAQQKFGSAAAALGQPIALNQQPLTIIGVLPPAFAGIQVGQLTDLWLACAQQRRIHAGCSASETDGDDRPTDPDWNREERVSWLYVLIRQRPGVPALAPAVQRAWADQRDDMLKAEDDPRQRDDLLHRTWTVFPAPGGESRFRAAFESTGFIISAIVGVMLVLVCANVSGLLLMRSMSRHREFGVRLAIGAGSFRVMRLSLFEAAILSVLGGAGGFGLGSLLLAPAAQLLAPGQALAPTLGARSILVMGGLVLGTTLFSALAPALWISRVEPLTALSGNRGLGRAPVRLGRILVVAQFAIAVTLVAVAAALGAELQRTLAADPGFVRDRVLTALFDAAGAGYAGPAERPLVNRLRAVATGVPGVESVGFASSGILTGSESDSGIYVRTPQARQVQRSIQHDTVLPGFFATVGAPVVAGRDFAETDTAKSRPVALVNAAFVRELLGTDNPVGQLIGQGLKPSPDDLTIVGVVADVHMNGVREKVPPLYYLPAAQVGDSPSLRFLAVRFQGPTAAVLPRLQAAIAQAEPGLVLTNWMTLADRMTDDVSATTAASRLAAIFGGCAMLLAGAGVAGSLGYLVVLRQREVALRIAIGAAPRHVLLSVLGDALRLGGLGVLLGLVIVGIMPRIPSLQAQLSGPAGPLPALLAAAAALLTAVVAGWLPARRASRVDPNLMLKSP